MTSGAVLYVADAGNHALRAVDIAAGSVSITINIARKTGSADGNAASAGLSSPRGVAVTPGGVVYLTDRFNGRQRIRRLYEGQVTTVIDADVGAADGSAKDAKFKDLRAIAVGPHGQLYVADAGSHTIRGVRLANSCNLGGTCFGLGASSAAIPCELCDPAKSTTKFVASAGTCDDGDFCTAGETCDGNGKCAVQGKNFDDCDDGNPCTKDSCSKATGCQHALINGCTSNCSKDADCQAPNDLCHTAACSANECKIIAKKCDDGNACTDDSCDDAKGCVKTVNQNACSTGTDGCSGLGVCGLGTCTKAERLGARVLFGADPVDIRGSTTLADDIAFVGAIFDFKTKTQDGFVAAVTGVGTEIKRVVAAAPNGTNGSKETLTHVSQAPEGGIGAFGHFTVGAAQKPWLVRIDSKGDLLRNVAIGAFAGEVAGAGAVTDDDTRETPGFALVFKGKGTQKSHFIRINSFGDVLASHEIALASDSLDVAWVSSTGAAIAAGTSGSDLVVRSLGRRGRQSWRQTLKMQAGVAPTVLDIATAPSGKPTILVKLQGSNSSTSLVVDVHSDVQKVAARSAAVAKTFTKIAASANDRLLAAGHLDKKGWIQQLNVGTKTLAGKEWTLSGLPCPSAVQPLPNGDVVVVFGQCSGLPAAWKSQWQRVSAGLYDSCASAAKCSNLQADCDDGKACTEDWCTAASDCSALSLAKGTLCLPSDRCYATGKCDGTACKPDKLFGELTVTDSALQPTSMAPRPGGGVVVAGYTQNAADPRLWVSAHDAAGLPVTGPLFLPAAKGHGALDVIAADGGGAVAVGQYKGGPSAGLVARTKPDFSAFEWVVNTNLADGDTVLREVRRTPLGYLAAGDDFSAKEVKLVHLGDDGSLLGQKAVAPSCGNPKIVGLVVRGMKFEAMVACQDANQATVGRSYLLAGDLVFSNIKSVSFGSAVTGFPAGNFGPSLDAASGLALRFRQDKAGSVLRPFLVKQNPLYNESSAFALPHPQAGVLAAFEHRPGVVAILLVEAAVADGWNDAWFKFGENGKSILRLSGLDGGDLNERALGTLAVRDIAPLSRGRIGLLTRTSSGYNVAVYDAHLQDTCRTSKAGAKCPNNGDADCENSTQCAYKRCDPKTGCVTKPTTALCDDLSPCTLDKCDANGACSFTPTVDGTACKLSHGGGGGCKAGVCAWAKSVTAGTYHRCATLWSGNTACWGSGAHGLNGDASFKQQLAPTVVDGSSGLTKWATGESVNAAIDVDGTVFMMGNAQMSWAGDCKSNCTYAKPTKAAAGWPSLKSVATGKDTVCGLTKVGAVGCAGSNQRGVAGVGLDPAKSALVKAFSSVSLVGAAKAVGVFGGSLHFCAVTDDGGVQCWGRGTEGQLGNGDKKDTTSPVVASGLGGKGPQVTTMGLGDTHTCAVTKATDLYCWGNASGGRVLASGTQAGQGLVTAPTKVPGVQNVAKVAAGALLTCVLRTNGDVDCFGAAIWGGLGNGGQNSNNFTPTRVLLPTKAVDVSCSRGSTGCCATVADGRVYCWGSNTFGELGNGTSKASGSVSANVPQLVSGSAP